MKIVYLSGEVLPSYSAESVYVIAMCQAFAQHGHDVQLIACEHHANPPKSVPDILAYYGVDHPFDITRVARPRAKKGGRIWAMQAAKTALEIRPDVVYARSLAGALFAAQHGLPIIFESHQLPQRRTSAFSLAGNHAENSLRVTAGLWQWTRHRALAFVELDNEKTTHHAHWVEQYAELIRHRGFESAPRLFERLSQHPNLLRCVTITKALERDISSEFPALKDRTLVAADGAEPRSESPPTIPLRGNAGAINVGYCGHLYPGKGMEIIGELAPRCPWAYFHVVGGLEQDVRSWREHLNHCTNIFFYGHVEPHAVAGYISQFDICLLPNQKAVHTFNRRTGTKRRKPTNIGSYTSPMKMFEYMAAGKPIVASDLDVLREVLHHEINALLCPHDDVAQWITALKQLAANPVLRNYLGQNAHDDLIANYTWTARAARVLAHMN